ncbi:MAG: PIN domain-containing protein [Euryarchaeota archaeon]|nr:PIN domain-containing protein [Euryarchaeota archaeon]
MTDDIALLDTNILVYAYDISEEDKNPVCRELVKRCWEGEVQYAVSLQNLSEFFVVVTSKVANPMTARKAKERVSRIIDFSNWVKLVPDTETVLSAMDISARYGLHYWDSLIAAAMRQNGISRIITENTADFERVPWLEAINPFE